MGTVDELISKRFTGARRALRRAGRRSTTRELAALPAVDSVKRRRRARSCSTRATWPRRSARCWRWPSARGVEPQNLAIRRATLEDVFLDLTGRALRD